MHPTPPRLLRLPLHALLCVTLVCLSGATRHRAAAQESPPLPIKLFLSTSKAETKYRASGLELRPNVVQEVFVYVQNDSDKDKVVTVKLVSEKDEVLYAKLLAPKGQLTLLPLPPSTAPPAWADLAGPVVLRAVDNDGKLLARDFKLLIAHPRDYVTAPVTYNPAQKQLSANVSRVVSYPLAEPPCHVALDIRADRLSGMDKDKIPQGRVGGLLSPKPGKLQLAATNLPFNGEVKGFVYLTVDGYKRAFVYLANFRATGGDATPLDSTRTVMRSSLPSLLQPNAAYPLVIEVDGPPIAPKDRIKVELLSGKDEKTGKDEFSEIAEFASPRQEKLRFAKPGPRGGLLFQPEVKDLVVRVPLEGTAKTKVRLRLVDAEGKAREIIDGVTGKNALEVVQEITLDGSAPEGVKFVEPPKNAVRGKSLTVKAFAKDDESKITEMYFYLGKPGPDGKEPADVKKVPAQPVKNSPDVYSADFKIPADAKGPIDVTFVAKNGVDLESKISLQPPIEVVDPAPTASTISGKVFEKDSPVDFLPIRLLDAKGKVVGEVRSGDGGKFLFKELEPGAYKVAAARATSSTAGELPVTIKGIQEIKDLELILLPIPEKDKEKEAKKKLAKIEGVVQEGDRVQAGLPVVLSDAISGKVLDTAKTDKEGKYLFEGLPPGKYKVTASKSASMTKGTQSVEVKAGEKATVSAIKLYRSK